MAYAILVVPAHPDDAEVQMGGTLAALTDQGQRALLVDLCDMEPPSVILLVSWHTKAAITFGTSEAAYML